MKNNEQHSRTRDLFRADHPAPDGGPPFGRAHAAHRTTPRDGPIAGRPVTRSLRAGCALSRNASHDLSGQRSTAAHAAGIVRARDTPAPPAHGHGDEPAGSASDG